MADGGLTIQLDDSLSESLKACAEAAGLTPEEFAASVLRSAVAADWEESLRRLDEYDRTGEYLTVEEAMDHFDAAVARASKPES
jgi:hypothetical protein